VVDECGDASLQWLATDEFTPAADFAWNSFLAWKFDGHTLCEENSGLKGKN
jgi:hypothetical protein